MELFTIIGFLDAT